MTVDLSPPPGFAGDLAVQIAQLDDVTFAALGPEERERYDRIARLFLDLISDDDYHWGCTSAEAVEEQLDDAWEAGYERGFEMAKQRSIDGLTRLERASMVEAETVVEIVPRIRQMSAETDRPSRLG